MSEGSRLAANPIEPHPERVIGIIAYDGALLLNVAGPCEVFTMANRELARQRQTASSRGTGYRVLALSPEGGLARTSSGIELNTRALPEPGEIDFDTIAIVGGMTVRALANDKRLIDWLRESAPCTRRVAAFGAGAFVLAKAGLLDNRRCAIHWRIAEDLRRLFPRVIVETEALFVKDGNCLTAAGSAASMDLALQMVEDDFGKSLAVDVARVLVVSRMRPGDQPQLSVELRAQVAAAPRVAAAAEWIVNNIDRKPTVANVAERFAMSERNFSRVFTRDMGVSPQRFFEQARIEAARRWLVGSELPVDKVARRSGFSGGEHLAQTFKKMMGMTPGEYRAQSSENSA